MAKILLIEDDKMLNSTMIKFLDNHGHETTASFNGEEAYELMYHSTFDLIISDIMMPVVDGYEFLETIRQTKTEVPIIFMSANDDLKSKQKGYQLGVDDYIVKPVDLDELLLKIGAILRRAKINHTKQISVGNLKIDVEERIATVNDEEITLTTREFDILFKLLSYPKKTFTRSKLMEEFWDIETESSTRTVDVYITKLRDKFSHCSDFEIQTVHGLGYKAVFTC